jgi:hypothetical protein
VLVLVADAERDGDRDDAAQHAGPEAVEKLLVVREVDDDLVAGPGAEFLQMEEDAEGALVELRVRDGSFARLAFEVADRSLDAAAVDQQFGESPGVRHRHVRRSSFIIRGCLVRRLIWASSSSGRSGT